MEGEDFSFESISAILFNVSFKFVRASIVSLPVRLACDFSLSSFWFSLLHEVLSADIGFAIGGIGDAIDEPIIVPDIIRGKRIAFVNPRVFIINVFILSLIHI